MWYELCSLSTHWYFLLDVQSLFRRHLPSEISLSRRDATCFSIKMQSRNLENHFWLPGCGNHGNHGNHVHSGLNHGLQVSRVLQCASPERSKLACQWATESRHPTPGASLTAPQGTTGREKGELWCWYRYLLSVSFAFSFNTHRIFAVLYFFSAHWRIIVHHNSMRVFKTGRRTCKDKTVCTTLREQFWRCRKAPWSLRAGQRHKGAHLRKRMLASCRETLMAWQEAPPVPVQQEARYLTKEVHPHQWNFWCMPDLLLLRWLLSFQAKKQAISRQRLECFPPTCVSFGSSAIIKAFFCKLICLSSGFLCK